MTFSNNLCLAFVTVLAVGILISSQQVSSQGEGGAHAGSKGFSLPYMTSNVEEVSGKSFDYIVVGGGASGCPLVATLSQKYSLLLIERGGSPFNNPMISEATNFGLPLIQTDEFLSIAQRFVSEEGVMNLRGRVLGGSTAINNGFYSRASEDYVKKLGWDKKLVREAYEWIESKVVFQPNDLTEWQSIVKDSLVHAGGLPYKGFSLEHMPGTKVGGSIFDRNGKRHTAADLLAYGNLDRITVLLNATVKNVIFHNNGSGSKPEASGVKFIKSNGNGDQVYEVYLSRRKDTESRGDVILSAGALGSPQILLLSGIGPYEQLKHFNISPIVDATEVGKGIKDNPCFRLSLDSPKTPRSDITQVVGVTKDSQIIIQSAIGYITNNETTLKVAAKLAYPVSQGKLELKNIDPRQNPLVRFNYLFEEKDLDQCVRMGHLLEKIAQSNLIISYLGSEQNENAELSTEEELRELCKTDVQTYCHYHGGSSIGSVVDKDYKVYGVNRLRVLDGSTLPDAPGTNPMATLLMLGRYQGIKILDERDHNSFTCFPEHGGQYTTYSVPEM
ncbi:Hothead-like [Thalictrum thalictroides]|uniref:Hothead-like n=1 Tax=Thalictrum thalictroides TaxID=46969 RepID=A0A7J6WKJ4_THATH|nr:Hothead-like [Thalictrum thalictroides]